MSKIEPFLINPPKHAPKSKVKAKKGKHTHWSFPSASLLGKEGTLHRPRVYTMGGHWQTSLDSRVAKPGMRLNPYKKNPGEELMFIGANPFREVKHMTHRKHHKKHAKKHSYKHNPVHHKKHHGKKHYRHNPVLDGTMVKPVLAALAGGLATMIVPNLIGKYISGANRGIMGYLVKAGILVGGAYGVNKFMDKNAAIGFASGSGVVIGTEAAVEFMPSVFGAGSPAAVSVPALAPMAPVSVAGFERLNGFESRSAMGAIDDDGLYGNPLG